MQIYENKCICGEIKMNNMSLSSLYYCFRFGASRMSAGPQANCFLWHFCVFLIAACLTSTSVLAHDDVGETYPRHAEIWIGGDVNITCRMNTRRFNENNSSCLTFSKEHSNATIPKEHIHIVNETSIVYMIRNATEQSIRYVCKCNKSGVDITTVDVGTPPTDVTDFHCRGYDFSYMTCNFTVPENKILTRYMLKFSTKSPSYTNNCTLENGVLPSERICNMTIDNNRYRINYPIYNFKLTANNSLGTHTQSISVNHHTRVVPAKPAVEILNITSNSVTLSWVVTKFSHYNYTNGLIYEIRLRPEKFDWINIETKLVRSVEKVFWVDVTNLKYAFRRYDVLVRVKTAKAPNDGTMWSEPFVGSFVTRPQPPDNPPMIDVGSFYIDPTEQNLRLYWQQLPEWQENGPEFQYVITEVRRDGRLVNISPVHIDQTSAEYEWQRTSSQYEFRVKSQNQAGQSLNTSVLMVPPSEKRSTDPEQRITKVYHNQTYTVLWWEPADMDNLIDFTVFWCISKMESQSQCKGTISSQHFNKNTYNYTTEPQNHTLNFAVSANYRTYSTGMIWAMCTADVSTDLTKMDPEITQISANSIKVQWSTECLYTAILEGYNLTYCKVENNVSEKIGDCINAETTLSISKTAKEYTIHGLEPFTTYKVLILMYSKAKVGPVSNPVSATTTEDAPSPPRKLKSYNITSNSVVISWLPPIISNGNLRYYTVWQNTDHHTVNSTSNDTESEITFKLENLSSYSDYKIYVIAHTVKSSAPSNDIHIKTLIGYPSAPQSLIMDKGENSLVLRWGSPMVPSGRVEFYEIRVNVSKNNETENKVSRVLGNVCRINLSPCYDRSYTYAFEVRAVNAVEKSEVDYHTFSKRDTSMYATIHQGATKKRRHSNAEINSSIGGAYQIHETERHMRHRHERENLKLLLTSTTQSPRTTESPLVVAPSFEFSDDAHYENNEDLMCIGSEPVPQRYNDRNQYKHFASGWEKGPYYACGDVQFSKTTVIALVVVLVPLVLLASFYTARKKYHKMSNIGLMLPPGLDENIHTTKGVDNTIERDDIARSDELFYEKESHSLLSKIGNDSGILNSARSLDKNSTYVCNDHQDSEKSSQSTDSVELNDITSCSYTSSPSHSPNANIRETAATGEKFNPSIIQPISVQLRPSETSCINPMIMSNGYVQPQAFQKLQQAPPTFNGYTTLDAMGKPMFPPVSAAVASSIADNSYGIESKDVSSKDISTPQHINGNICGYVTCKQLSDFGQSLQ